jgi:segregation and condensation protein B
VESIRGVNSDYSVQKLLEKELIIIKGRKEDAVGKPLLYATSQSFMDYFGLNSPDDLPKIKEVVQEELPQPQEAPPAHQNGSPQAEGEIAEENTHFSVSENGQLEVNHNPEAEKEEHREEDQGDENKENPDDENEKTE